MKPSDGEAVPRPAVEASAEALAVTLQDVRNRWARVLEEVKRLKMFCHALLIEGMPLEVRGQTLVVGLRSGYNFHMESLHRPENRAVVEQALERVFGRRMMLRCQMQEGSTEPPLPQADAPPRAAAADDADPLVTRAMELFGGEVVAVKRLTDTA